MNVSLVKQGRVNTGMSSVDTAKRRSKPQHCRYNTSDSRWNDSSYTNKTQNIFSNDA